MQSLLKPKKLHSGDTVAAITLSWGGAGTFPDRYQIGKKRLEEVFGLTVAETKHAMKDADWIYRNPQARAEDLMSAFSDSNVRAIIATIGGEDSIRLLPYIDYSVLKSNPKIFLGFSDTTVGHFICLKAGLGSFYGPSVMTAFAENVQMHEYTKASILKTLFCSDTIGDITQNNEGWTAEFLDWSVPENNNVRRKMHRAERWRFISGAGCANGRLIGGCVEVLQFIIGTEIWPSISTFADSILFLETSEEGLPPVQLERFLRNLGAQGILKVLKGLLFSRPGGSIDPSTFPEYDKAILTVLNEYDRTDLAVITNMEFGHTDPMITLPYGILAEIDVAQESFRILDTAVT